MSNGLLIINNYSDLVAARSQIRTVLGKFHLFVEILSAAVEKNDRILAFDVLWALESLEEYLKVF